MKFARMMALLGLPLASAAATVTVNQMPFTVPEGFTVELVAGSGLAPRPVSASFDDRGRLYVTDSSGSNEAPSEQLKHPDHRVLRLEDRDGDGIFDTSEVFATEVMFPQGCLWHEGSVYVAAPPSIWKFTDTDGDGKADRREEWFKGGTLTGCANDIHGPHAGPDGYLYWTKGAFAEQTHPLGDGRRLQDKAAHIFRARPDGSDLGVVMSGGMDNPVEIAFTPDGEVLFSSTFIDFSQPGFRDGIAHAIHGGVFGKQNEALEDGRVIRTGPDLFHPFFQAGPAAECGLMQYTSAAFGTAFRDTLFATSFNLHKVTHHVLRPEGATYASTDSDFLVTDAVDFHPTDVLEDADGSLLVVDTGGWYRLCCPSSQLAKPDVLGAIYRVRREGAARPKDLWASPRLPSEPNDSGFRTAAALLGDDRFSVREAAASWLAKAGAPALPAVREAILKGPSWRQRHEAAWVAFRIGTPAATAALGEALVHSDPGLRRVAAKALALHPDPAVVPQLAALLDHEDPALVRSAAEGLGRLRIPDFIPALLKATAGPLASDPFLEHSLIHALICIGSPDVTRMGLIAESSRTRRAALVALDQMNEGALNAPAVLPFLDAPDERLRTAANWILTRHPDWGGDLAAEFRKRLTATNLTADARASVNRQLGLLARDARGQELLAEAAEGGVFPPDSQASALSAIAGAPLKERPERWRTAVLAALAKPADAFAPAALAAARGFSGDADVGAALRRLARQADWPADRRLSALAALPPGSVLEDSEFALVTDSLDTSRPPETRSAAARLLAQARLHPTQLRQLTPRLASAGPLELNQLLQAYDAGGDETLGRELLAALQESRSARALHPTQLQPHFAKFPESLRVSADAFVTGLNTDAGQQAARLDALLAELKTANGDLRRGQSVFNGPKAACASCHRIGYLGGDVGPELTRIGEVRSERDLLESIVYPSLSFVRSYEPTRVTLKGGDEFNGIVRRETPEDITVVTGPGAEQRIRREEIVELSPGVISVMPGGLDEQLTRQELADLLVFVKTVRWR
ncbi:MAG: HEAT repeat domain-containing protein [Verrucomicrobiae bacterium]|nr:HEAT repeat domain-containing protein [Verrucomicrobiae bacterium]